MALHGLTDRGRPGCEFRGIAHHRSMNSGWFGHGAGCPFCRCHEVCQCLGLRGLQKKWANVSRTGHSTMPSTLWLYPSQTHGFILSVDWGPFESAQAIECAIAWPFLEKLGRSKVPTGNQWEESPLDETCMTTVEPAAAGIGITALRISASSARCCPSSRCAAGKAGSAVFRVFQSQGTCGFPLTDRLHNEVL